MALIRSLYLAARAAYVMLCLVLACGRARAAEDVHPSVGVDFTTLDAATYREIDGLALEKATVLRLVQEGFPVVAVAASPVVLVSLRRVPDGLLIEARGRSTARAVQPLAEGSLAEFHLVLVQRIVALARLSAKPTPANNDRDAAGAAPQPQADVTRPSVASETRATRRGDVDVEAGAGAVWRGDTPDLLVRAGFRYAATTRLGARTALGFTPSTGPGISVREWHPEVGLDYRLLDLSALRFEAGIGFGLVLQHYELADPAAEDREGVLIDVVVRVPFTLSYSARHFGLGAWVAPGVANQRHRHTLNDEVLWDRGALRADSGVAVLGRW